MAMRRCSCPLSVSSASTATTSRQTTSANWRRRAGGAPASSPWAPTCSSSSTAVAWMTAMCSSRCCSTKKRRASPFRQTVPHTTTGTISGPTVSTNWTVTSKTKQGPQSCEPCWFLLKGGLLSCFLRVIKFHKGLCMSQQLLWECLFRRHIRD